MEYEIEAVHRPNYDGDPWPWYAVATDKRSGRQLRVGPDAATEDEAREGLRALMEGKPWPK